MKDFFKLFKHLSSRFIHTKRWMIESPLEHLSPREDEKRGKSFSLGLQGHPCFGRSPPYL